MMTMMMMMIMNAGAVPDLVVDRCIQQRLVPEIKPEQAFKKSER